MFNPLTLVADYDELDFLNKLPGYDSSNGVIEQLDLVKEIQSSGNYYWQGVSFPSTDKFIVPGLETLTGSLQMVPGTYITSINCYFDYQVDNFIGFQMNLWDKGSKAGLSYGDYELERLVASDMEERVGQGNNNPPSDPGMNQDNPFGSGYRMSPFIITSPGILNWEITNLGNRRLIQVLLNVAVPVRKLSIGQIVVDRGK